MTTAYHLAQFNVARIRAPLEDPIMADFVNNLSRINQLADASPGFIWRLQTEKGDSTSIRPYDDQRLLITLSVWESVEALVAFTYRNQHAAMMTRRREWFEHIEAPYLVLWWLPAGEIPTLVDATGRLEWLRREGPTPQAFTIRQTFPPPGHPAECPLPKSQPIVRPLT